jgi:hypothetical protein
VLNGVAGAATNTHASARSLLDASQTVAQTAANLRREVESFLDKVAA